MSGKEQFQDCCKAGFGLFWIIFIKMIVKIINTIRDTIKLNLNLREFICFSSEINYDY